MEPGVESIETHGESAMGGFQFGDKRGVVKVEGGGVDKVDEPGSFPEATPVPASSSLSVLAPSSSSPSVQLPAPASSFGRNCVQPQFTAVDRTPYYEPT